MRPYDIIKLAYKNVSRGRTGACLSAVSVAVGIGAVIALLAIGNSAKATVSEKLGGFGMDGIVIFAGDGAELTPEDGESITQSVSGIESAMPFEFWFSYYRLPHSQQYPTLIIGADETIGDYLDVDVLTGRSFTEGECKSAGRVCIVDSELARSKFGHIDVGGESIILIVDGRELEYEIIGVCTSAMEATAGLMGMDIPPFIYVPWTSVCGSEDEVSQLVFKTSDSDTDAAQDVKDYLSAVKTSNNYDVEDMSAYREEFSSVIDSVTSVLGATAAISLFVAAMGVTGTMLSSVSERQREIGICKAIGATSLDICAIFMAEAVMITAAGCAAGTLCGVCLVYALFYSFFSALPDITAYSVAAPCAVTVLSGLVSGVIPALKAARLSPVNAIRKDR